MQCQYRNLCSWPSDAREFVALLLCCLYIRKLDLSRTMLEVAQEYAFLIWWRIQLPTVRKSMVRYFVFSSIAGQWMWMWCCKRYGQRGIPAPVYSHWIGLDWVSAPRLLWAGFVFMPWRKMHGTCWETAIKLSSRPSPDSRSGLYLSGGWTPAKISDPPCC